MTPWRGIALTLAAWLAVVLAVGRYGDAMGSYQALMWAFAVAVTGGMLGTLPAVVAGAVVGTLVGFDVTFGMSGFAWRARLGDGALLWPLALVGVGVGAAVTRTLLSQLRHHRVASDRAQYDVLTGTLNRRAFERRLDDWIRRPCRGEPGFALLFVDLDRFKFVNDTFGHAVGDQLLVAVARLLQQNVRDGDLVARQGGDEFVIALADVHDVEVAAAVATKLVGLFAEPLEAAGKAISVSASIGVAMYPHDGAGIHEIVRSADAAMYAVKTNGKNAFHFSSLEQRRVQERRLQVERQLRIALVEQEFQVAYQPQLELATGRLCGFEALLRWNNAELGPVSPTEFVPIAEEAGLIVPIGHWLMREVCRQAQAWEAFSPDLTLAINVSPGQFRHPDFLRQVADAIRDARVAPRRIELEVTESILIDQYDLAVETLLQLDQLGVRTSLDDFGTGYSSLAYLQRLPIRSLKIDRSFVSGLVLGPSGIVGDTLPIVEAIAAMGLKLGKTVVAEGVETEAQARYLNRIGVGVAQGFHYARPMPAARAESLLERLAALPLAPEPRDPSWAEVRTQGALQPPPQRPVPVRLPLPMPATEVARTLSDVVLVLDAN